MKFGQCVQQYWRSGEVICGTHRTLEFKSVLVNAGRSLKISHAKGHLPRPDYNSKNFCFGEVQRGGDGEWEIVLGLVSEVD